MTDTAAQDVPQHVEFASLIVKAANDGQFDATAVFNGIATAVAAMLVDYSADDLGNVNQGELLINLNKFNSQVAAAVGFAVDQLSTIVRATTTN